MRILLFLALVTAAQATTPTPTKTNTNALPPVFDLHHDYEYFSSHGPSADALLAQAQDARAAGDLKNAEKLYRQFIAAGPGAPQLGPALAALAEIEAAQQEDAAARETINHYVEAFPHGPAREELLFWKGFGAYRMQAPTAENDLRDYLKQFPESPRAFEARRTLGLLWRREGKTEEAAATFDNLAANFSAMPHRAGEGRLLAFLTRAESKDPAMRLAAVVNFDALRKDEGDRIAALELGALQLGAALLDQNDPAHALVLLRWLRPRAEVDAAQQARLAEIDQEIGLRPDQAGELRTLQAAMKEDAAALDAVPDYDAVLHLDTAAAFARTGRDREAALLLADALPTWPASSKAAAATQLAACYAALNRWADVLATIDTVSEPTPALRLLRAQAEQNLNDLPAAIATLQALRNGPPFPESDRAAFLLGCAEHQAGREDEAGAVLAAFDHDFPKSSYREAAAYWNGLTLFARRDYAGARTAWSRTRADFPHGTYEAECLYQEARALCAEHNYAACAKAVEAFRDKFPDGPEKIEALILLGDCRLAVGKYREGIALLEQVPAADTPLYGYAVLRIGAAREVMGEESGAAQGYAAFLKQFPENPTAPQILARVARLDLRTGREDEALALTLDAASRSGDGPDADPLFVQIAALGKSAALRPKIDPALETWSKETTHPTRAARACWAQSRLAADPTPALLRGAALATPTVGSALRADFADALRQSGKTEEARAAYETLLATSAAPRAHAGLGLLDLADPAKARAEFQAAATGTADATFAPAWKAWAELDEKAGRTDEALDDWERLLRLPGLPAVTAVAALNHLGDLYMEAGHPDKAVPCYQRIYVMYGRWPDYVARAYWESGQAFEKLARTQEAVNTYRELAGRSDLASFNEAALAKERLRALGAGS